VPSFTSTENAGNGGHTDTKTDRHNRYLIPRYPLDHALQPGDEPVEGTGMAVAWTRVSTILDVHKDKEGIFKWTKRLIVKGIGGRPDLYALAAAARVDDRSGLLDIANQAFDYAKGQASSNLGTALHNFRERVDAGEDVDIPQPWADDIAAYQAALKEAGITVRPDLQELVVVRPDLRDGDAAGLAGRFDLIVEWKGELVMADLKTGSDPLQWGAWEIQQQLGTYSSAWAIWDGTHFRPLPAVRKDKVLMIHLLPGQAACSVEEIDVDPVELEADLAAAYRTRARRKAAKTAHRPVSAAVANPHPAASMVTMSPVSTPQMVADATKAAERLAKVVEMSNPNEEGELDAVVVSGPGAPDHESKMAERNLDGLGQPLEPLVVPPAKGCSVCRRKGHRKGSPKCLGAADPALPGGAGRRVGEMPCAHGAWTRNPLTGTWECGECQAPAAAEHQDELTAAQAVLDEAATIPEPDDEDRAYAEAMRARPRDLEPGDRPEDGADPMTNVAAEELAAVEADPFQEDELEVAAADADWHLFLDRINEAPDKATIRSIRAEATDLGVWDDRLLQAGLARIKSFSA
jgi:hypothetical protein